MDQSVRLVNSFAVASHILTRKRKTTQMEGIFQNVCLGPLRRDASHGHERVATSLTVSTLSARKGDAASIPGPVEDEMRT